MVSVPPSLTTKPSDQTVLENQEVTFQCTATGNPAPRIKWIKAGKTLIEGDILTFKAIKNTSGQYWCSAENGLDLANASAYLDVQCKYSCIEGSLLTSLFTYFSFAYGFTYTRKHN